MTTTLTTRDESLPAPYSEALDALSVGPLWTALHQLLPNERVTAARPHRWRWREVRPQLLEAARLVPIEQAERRVLVLRNPGLGGAYAVTATLFAGLQIILPGEAAPSHHHTPAALRLVVEGRGAYTTVDGVKCVMEPGDLIITPPMRWHDHGHEGREPVVWLDGLDIPLVRSFDASWASRMRAARPPGTGTDSSQDEFTAAGLVPRRSRYEDTGYPQVRWPWSTVRRALASMAAAAPADQPVGLCYVNPKTGAPPLATMGCECQWLRPGETARIPRRTSSAVYQVIEGRGESRVGDATFAWEPGDTLVAPPWHAVEHVNLAPAAPACLFQFNDEPAVRALGLWREEPPA
ncbi:MAG: cupin domain-containing protein [Candidatus Rokubacteria bacterium]|nr:cupin domain-containing protein [Candidatus Rokubacteria bacterium]